MNQLDRERIRRYLLGTADEREQMEVERSLHQAEWAAAFAQEQDRLNREDAARQGEAPAGFTPVARGGLKRAKWLSNFDSRIFLVVIATVAILLAIPAALLFGPEKTPAQHAARLQLRNFAVALKMYSSTYPDGSLPPAAPYDGIWMFDVSTFYPSIIDDPATFVGPSTPNREQRIAAMKDALRSSPPDWETATRIAAEGFTYTGYAMLTPEDVAAVMTPSNETNGGIAMREGVERFAIVDINDPGASARNPRDIPMLVEGAARAARGDTTHPIYVIMMDGTMKTYRMPDVPPVVRAIIRALAKH